MPASSQLPRLTAVPAARSKAAVLKVRLFLVLGLLVICALAGIASATAWIVSRPAPSALTSRDVLPRGVGIAEIVARAWLDGQPVPIPTVRGLEMPADRSGSLPVTAMAWEGYSTDRLPAPNSMPYEVHRFLFTTVYQSEDGPRTRTLRIFVPVATTQSGPLLAALPMIDSPRFKPGESSTFDYKDLGAQPIPEAAERELGIWLTAWAACGSGDLNGEACRELKQLTGDLGPGTYIGLGQFTVKDWSVVSAVPFGGNEWLVRVRATLTGPNSYVTEMEMDVTVNQANTTAPRITGWGPAGSGTVSPDQVRIISQ